MLTPNPTPPPKPETPAAPPPAKTETPPAAPATTTPAPRTSFFDEIETLSKEAPPKPAPKKEAGPENPTVAPAAAEKPADESGKKETGSADAATSLEAGSKPVKAAELRTAYDDLKKKHAALEKEYADFKAKPPPEDTEKKTLLERLTEREKRIKEVEEELKFTSFERTEEYKVKFEKPFVRAFQNGRTKAAALKVTDGEGLTRQGTEADFDAIMRISDDATASEKAAEMFGAQAPVVLWHRENVQNLNSERVSAIEEARKGADARQKELTEKQAREKATLEEQRTKLGQEFKRLNDEAVAKYPQWFKADEGDEKGVELLKKGFEVADMAFNGSQLPPDEMVKVHSAMRNKAAGFDFIVYKLKSASDRVKELETELAQFKASEPGVDDNKRVKETKAMTFEEEIDAIATR